MCHTQFPAYKMVSGFNISQSNQFVGVINTTDSKDLSHFMVKSAHLTLKDCTCQIKSTILCRHNGTKIML